MKSKQFLLPAIAFAALTWVSFQAAITTGEPWDWQFPGARESAGGRLPDWFVRGQHFLIWRYGTVFTLLAAISGSVALGSFPRVPVSLPGRVAFSCPAFTLPLCGWLGMFSLLPAAAVAAIPSIVVIVQAARRRTVGADLASLHFNLLVIFCVYQYGDDWFSVFGD